MPVDVSDRLAFTHSTQTRPLVAECALVPLPFTLASSLVMVNLWIPLRNTTFASGIFSSLNVSTYLISVWHSTDGNIGCKVAHVFRVCSYAHLYSDEGRAPEQQIGI